MHAMLDSFLLLAEDPPSSFDLLGQHLIAAVVFSIIGVIVFVGSLFLMEKLAPFSIVKEIEEDQNTALAVIMASVVLGMAIIIAAAILG